QVKRRQRYYVKSQNTLWHIDGYHKLICWGIVIHGFIDRFCRTVSGITLWVKGMGMGMGIISYTHQWVCLWISPHISMLFPTSLWQH
ncbi:hypothetical protein BU15DRAFT_54820, partial [Melanogaster broomeanus]